MKKFKETGSKKDICPNCEEDREIKIGTKKEILTINKEPIEINAQVEYCPVCQEYFADSETEEKNIQRAYRVYRQKHGLLQPDEIKAIREKYGISQRAFSRLLGWGEITFHRYEAGGLQDEAHNNELLLLKDSDNFRVLFEKSRNKFSPRIVRRIEARLEEIPQKSLYHCLGDFFLYQKSDIYSGFRHFDEDRFENAVLYFTSSISTVFWTKLNKLLWYFDFITFKDTGLSATGAVYLKAPHGPVPKDYELFIGGMISEKTLEPREVVFEGEPDVAGEILRALEEPDLSIFSSPEIACLKKVVESLSNLSSAQISKLSHAEEGFKNTTDWDKISYDWAKKLKIPG